MPTCCGTVTHKKLRCAMQTLRVPTSITEQEEVQVEVTRLLVECYFDIVRANLQVRGQPSPLSCLFSCTAVEAAISAVSSPWICTASHGSPRTSSLLLCRMRCQRRSCTSWSSRCSGASSSTS